MATTNTGAAADRYAARVDAVLTQRTRLLGPPPARDLFAGLAPDHPLIAADPRRPLEPNLEIIASYVEPDDLIIDAGGGAGRISLPLALRCRGVVNVEPSVAMAAGFRANAAQAGISNASVVAGDWLAVDPPRGSLALSNHVAYQTRDIAPFIERLEWAGARRVLLTVNDPPPPSWHRVLFQLVHGEREEVEPGHIELINVLWEMGVLPDIRVLPSAPTGYRALAGAQTRQAAIDRAVAGYHPQWSHWPLAPELQTRLRAVLDTRFEQLFAASPDGFAPRWITPGREILITWRPELDRRPN